MQTSFNEWVENKEYLLAESYWRDTFDLIQSCFEKVNTHYGSHYKPMNRIDLLKAIIGKLREQGDPAAIKKGKDYLEKAEEHGFISRNKRQSELEGRGDLYDLNTEIDSEPDKFSNWWSGHVRQRYANAMPYSKLPANADTVYNLGFHAFPKDYEVPDYQTAVNNGNLGLAVTKKDYNDPEHGIMAYNNALKKFGFQGKEDAQDWHSRITSAGRKAYGKPYKSFQ